MLSPHSGSRSNGHRIVGGDSTNALTMCVRRGKANASFIMTRSSSGVTLSNSKCGLFGGHGRSGERGSMVSEVRKDDGIKCAYGDRSSGIANTRSSDLSLDSDGTSSAM